MKNAASGFGLWVAVCVLALALPWQPARAAEADKSPSFDWVTPAVAGYGKVHPRPDAAVQPDPAVDYRIFVRVTDDGKHPRESLHALDRLARLVNLMAVSKVPASHVHIVALLDGEAALASATDDVYHRFTKVAKNPNLPIVHALHQAGVDLLVCGQALAMEKLPDSAVVPDVTVSLSALTDTVVYEQKGYSYLEL
ncbi:MAG TPA: DsrE family protein [Frateuria sp.]|uniref:DsrE family protein n=1 Tax=Frateuria sp. TaxID=2211372 RepID=UPI002DF25872|nr:DsrE family protein [Frateuria sp.]